ncbi:MAG: FRG domain-containing protein [Magnetococcales bacterium]|nr:FRG domain-containing protein [Magnetococcales bacterium]
MLEKIGERVDGAEWKDKEALLHVSNPHALTQVAGYVKYVSARNNRSIYYRGQNDLHHGKMVPPLYRLPSIGQNGITSLGKKLDDYINEAHGKNAFLRGTPYEVCEPLLQHYGMKTRWIDIVDNVWVSLWFACYNIRINGHMAQYVNYERRNTCRESGGFAYIVLMGIENPNPHNNLPGYFKGDDAWLIDLRLAAPSVFIRPHAQYGLLLKRKTICNDCDMSHLVVDRIRINLCDALAWLGVGELLSAHTFFPPPTYDSGYRTLLEKAPAGSKELGSVWIVGA